MKSSLVISAALLLAALANPGMAANIGTDDITPERGRNVVQTGSCNHCHVAHFTESVGKVSETYRLVGNSAGFQTTGGAVLAGGARAKRRG